MRTLLLAGADETQFVAWDGRFLDLRTSRAFAPGAPVRLTVSGDGDAPFDIEGKTVGCRRWAEGGAFELRVRIINLTRESRARFDAQFG